MPRKINGIEITERNRFSTFVAPSDATGLLDLRQWVDWFNSVGIPAILHLTDQGYAVYRNGMEEVYDDV